MKIYILSLIYEFYNCKGCLSLIFYSHKQRLEIPKKLLKYMPKNNLYMSDLNYYCQYFI